MTRILQSWPAYLVLALGLGVTLAAWRDTDARVQRDAQIQFRHEVAGAVQTLDRHLQESVALLIGLGGLYEASEVLDRQEFHRYLAGFDLLERYRGVRLVFLARLVEGGQAQRLVVDYVEPLAGNERVFGFDLYSDPRRRASLEYARDRGRITASGPIQLVADPVERRSVVLQLPLYRRGAAAGTLVERRAAFAGVLTLAIQVDQLIEHYLSGQVGRDFELTLHDAGYLDAGAPASGPDWLYRGGRDAQAQAVLESAPDRLRHVSSLQVAGRAWRLEFSTPATRPYGIGGELPQVVLLGGLVTSALLFWVVLAQLRARRRAQLLAQGARDMRAAADLREQLAFIQQLIEAVPQPIFFKDADGRYLGVNRAWEHFFGIPRAQFLGKSVFELYPQQPDLAQRHHAKDSELFASPGSQSYEAAIRDAQGKLRNTIYNKATFNRSDGTVAGLIGTITDVTGLKDAEAALRASEARFRDLTELSSDWYWEQDAELRTTQVSSKIGDFALDVTQYLGKRRWEGDIEGVSEEQWRAHRATLEAHQPFQNFVYQRPDTQGQLRTISISGRPIFDEQGAFRGYRGTGRDITEQRLSEEKIRHMAQHDALTQLPNRVLLQDRIGQAAAQARRSGERLALLFIDLDRFKNINDSLGHAAGDRLLREVAARLRDCTRAADTVARIGGDEFVVLLGNLQEAETARHVAQKILDALARPFALEGHALKVTPSIGITVFPDDGTDVDTLLRNADTAMYHAKQAGRNNCQYFRQEMNDAARSRLQLENDLRQAIERAEFSVHYQPQIDLRGGVIVGFEALVRWRHPRRGMVPPQEFIAAAEETGLIRPLGEYVLREACAQARAWRQAGYGGLRAAVNCSARQFRDDGILEAVDRALRESGLPASSLDLEITESILLDGTDSVNARFRALRERGVRIAIDDFGTGYSSLSYLKRLSIQQLKIDRSFVRDIGTDPDDAAIVSAIIAIAHTLGLEVVAEGIETPEQLAYLRRAGCDFGQGYLFSAPLPAVEFERLLAGWDPASLPA
jgi:diguanylate cyclase (GGDEF)-like protein/PAS domain S-box-containing protein